MYYMKLYALPVNEHNMSIINGHDVAIQRDPKPSQTENTGKVAI